MTTDPQTDRVTAIYDSINAFQRTHRLPGLQHAQIRGLLAEHLARAFPAAVPSAPVDRAALRDRIAEVLWPLTDWDGDRLNAERAADLVLAVLPAPVDRAAVLREAADDLATAFGDPMAKHIGALGASHLRRRAREIEAGQTTEAQPETPLEKRFRYSERRNDELRAECKRRGKINLEYAEKIERLEKQLDEVRTQLGAEILRAGQAETELRRMADEEQQPETRRCVCPHPADEHSVYGCVDGCSCEWMPKRPVAGEEQPTTNTPRCLCGAPIEWMDVDVANGSGWIHSPGSDTPCLTAIPAGAALPGQPQRGDEFEQWLKTQRDEYEVRSSPQWAALDEVLDTYRLHADTGTPLGEHVCEGQAVGDCDCLEKPAVVPQPEESTPAPTVAYSGKGRVWCITCPLPADEDVPLTIEAIDPWECCAGCGRYVVDVARAAVAQPGKEN